MRGAKVELRRNLQDLIAEVRALRDEADRVCRETQDLRKTYRRAIQKSGQLLRQRRTTHLTEPMAPLPSSPPATDARLS